MRTPIALFLVLAGALPALGQDYTDRLEKLVARLAPAIVTVKAVLKTESKFGGESRAQESRINLTGVTVSPDGLVMLSNTAFSPTRAMEMLGMPAEMRDEMGMKTTPTTIKVVFGNEETEYEAFVAATDANLDLMFVKVEGLGDRKLPFVDFGAGTQALVGQRVVQVNRLGRGYDYAPYFQTAVVNGEIATPRKAWLLEGSVSTLGLPVFALGGEVIGVLTTIPAGVNEPGSAEAMGLSMFMRLMSGGGTAGTSFVLPASVVKGIVEQAKAKAVEVAAQRARKPKEQTKPASQPTTKPATKPNTKPPAKPGK